MRKLFPNKSKPIPTGVQNIEKKVITNTEEKKKVIINHFVHRLRKRPQKEEVKSILKLKEDIFFQRLDMAKLNRSPPFEMCELEEVLKELKVGKSS